MDFLLSLWLMLFGQTVQTVQTTTTAYGTVQQVVVNKFKAEAGKVDLATILNFIHYQESTAGQNPRGHHVYCRSLGKTNEYGFDVFGSHRRCFTDKAEALETVTKWLVKYLSKYSLAQTLCTYNTGQASNDCPYYQHYLVFVDRHKT